VTLGRSFYVIAAGPLWALRTSLERGDPAAGLNAVHSARLAGALYAGVGHVARECALGAEAVGGVLPIVEIELATATSSVALGHAIEVWNQHHGNLSEFVAGFVGGFVEVYLGIEGSGVGEFLAAVGNSFVQDERLAEPTKELFASLHVYDQILPRCAAVLDSEPLLNNAARRVRRRRFAKRVVFGSIAIGCAVGGGAWWFSQPDVPSSDASASTDTAASPTLAEAPRAASSTSSDAGASASAKVASKTAGASTARPAPRDPRARANCLAACVAKCSDDANCERTCARQCPIP
jgi:hypothetical protein